MPKAPKLVDDQLEDCHDRPPITYLEFGRTGLAMQVNAIGFGHGHIRENSEILRKDTDHRAPLGHQLPTWNL